MAVGRRGGSFPVVRGGDAACAAAPAEGGFDVAVAADRVVAAGGGDGAVCDVRGGPGAEGALAAERAAACADEMKAALPATKAIEAASCVSCRRFDIILALICKMPIS